MNTNNSAHPKLPIVVLISGSGSNLQAIIDATQQGLPVEISAVISNVGDAYGLTRAQAAGIPHHCISHRDYPSRTAFEVALQQQIDAYQPKLIVLAGFMRYLTADFVQHYLGRMINIHPSLLPKYPGLHTHQAALAAKDEEHGATIHFVTEDLDQGPIISQGAIPIKADDTEESLQQRVLTQIEHRLYPQTLEWFATGRIELRGDEVYFDGKLLPKQGERQKISVAEFVIGHPLSQIGRIADLGARRAGRRPEGHGWPESKRGSMPSGIGEILSGFWVLSLICEKFKLSR